MNRSNNFTFATFSWYSDNYYYAYYIFHIFSFASKFFCLWITNNNIDLLDMKIITRVRF
jgi:hypothetical protein